MTSAPPVIERTRPGSRPLWPQAMLTVLTQIANQRPTWTPLNWAPVTEAAQARMSLGSLARHTHICDAFVGAALEALANTVSTISSGNKESAPIDTASDDAVARAGPGRCRSRPQTMLTVLTQTAACRFGSSRGGRRFVFCAALRVRNRTSGYSAHLGGPFWRPSGQE
jgi:hypothetical protein